MSMNADYEALLGQCDLSSPVSRQVCSVSYVSSVVMGPCTEDAILTRTFTTVQGVIQKARQDAGFQNKLCRAISNSYVDEIKKTLDFQCYHCSGSNIEDFSHLYFCNWKSGSLRQILAVSLPYCGQPGHAMIARISAHGEGRAAREGILARKSVKRAPTGCPNCSDRETWSVCADCRIQGKFTYGRVLPECDLAAPANRQARTVSFVCSFDGNDDDIYSNTFHTIVGVIEQARQDKVFLKKFCLAMSTHYTEQIKTKFPSLTCCCCDQPAAAFASNFFCNWHGKTLKQVLALSLPFCDNLEHANYAVRVVTHKAVGGRRGPQDTDDDSIESPRAARDTKENTSPRHSFSGIPVVGETSPTTVRAGPGAELVKLTEQAAIACRPPQLCECFKSANGCSYCAAQDNTRFRI